MKYSTINKFSFEKDELKEFSPISLLLASELIRENGELPIFEKGKIYKITIEEALSSDSET